MLQFCTSSHFNKSLTWASLNNKQWKSMWPILACSLINSCPNDQSEIHTNYAKIIHLKKCSEQRMCSHDFLLDYCDATSLYYNCKNVIGRLRTRVTLILALKWQLQRNNWHNLTYSMTVYSITTLGLSYWQELMFVLLKWNRWSGYTNPYNIHHSLRIGALNFPARLHP